MLLQIVADYAALAERFRWIVGFQVQENESLTDFSYVGYPRSGRRDGVAMKVIAGLTMMFLPATSVAAFFSMVFFKVAEDGRRSSFSVGSSTEYIAPCCRRRFFDGSDGGGVAMVQAWK